MNSVKYLISSLFCVAVVLFFGLAYPHHLHYQEQFQLFLFDSNYVWDIVKQPGGVADLLGRFCTQFFLYAWVGAVIIGVLLSVVQLLTLQLIGSNKLYGLSFLPSFFLWLFLLDEHALMGGVWAVLLTLLAVWGLSKLPKGWVRYIGIIVVLPILYWMVGSYWSGSHYYRYPRVFPTLLYVAWLLALAIPLLVYVCRKWLKDSKGLVIPLCSFALVAVVMGAVVWKNANFKAEKVMQYDFMASHQQIERVAQPNVIVNFYNQMKNKGVDYDIIGLSYYPYFHGNLNTLETAISTVENNFDKPIQIVETGYPSQWAIGGSTYDYTSVYPYSVAGQKAFTADLITLLKNHPKVNGLSWWYPEANAKGCTGNLQNGWYNAGLFNNNTGRALDAFYELKNFK